MGMLSCTKLSKPQPANSRKEMSAAREIENSRIAMVMLTLFVEAMAHHTSTT